jgi:hypothetical protein
MKHIAVVLVYLAEWLIATGHIVAAKATYKLGVRINYLHREAPGMRNAAARYILAAKAAGTGGYNDWWYYYGHILAK